MNTKWLNKSRILSNILPSVFFIVVFALYMGELRPLPLNLIAVGFMLLILVNVFLYNKIISLILGIIFLLGSCYMMLALFSDVINGKAALGYIVMFFLVLISIGMSALLMLRFIKKQSK